MDSEAMKNQRKKELEEKKKRIAEYKEKNKNVGQKPSSLSSPTTTAAASPSPTSKGMDFDSLMDSIHQMVPSPVATSPTQTEQSQQVPEDIKSPAADEKKYKPVLTVQSLVIDIDLPPKEIPKYSKGTQTIDPEPLTEEEIAARSVQSTPSKSKLKYQPSFLTQSQSQMQQQQQQSSNQGTDTAIPEAAEESSSSNEPEIIVLNDLDKSNILESDSFKSFFSRTSKVIERALCLDDSIDILVDYTKSDEESKSSSKELTLIGTLQDERWSKHRSVTDINWSPKHPELVVTSYSANEAGSHDPDGVVLVWTVNNYFQKPEYVFNCQSPVMTTFFSRYHPTLIVGGTYSGQIVVWDTRSKSTPVQRTPLSSVGHTHPVYSMAVVGSANANSLVSISTDGKLCSWSLDNLSQPIETLDLNSRANTATVSTTTSIAVTSLVFPETEMNTFYVGTEEGVIYQAQAHGAKAGVNERFKAHYGPVTSIDFHPPSRNSSEFSNLFLSSSTDWTCRLWSSSKPDQPIYSFEDYTDYVFDARWSPVNPSIFATGDGSGQLALWDLNEETEAPIFRAKTSSRSLNRLSWSADGRRLLVGDSGGQLSLYDSSQFASPQVDDWTKFGEVINKLTSKPLSLQQDSPILGSNLQSSEHD
ncbi:cytoplasmic dynein intermediate chain [Heterostelium album PN500]|uniref:Cytoplasmic dynein intermediate chain n=1 Tax=Heterostelium pallidum (strain ATCC 26659 / Pp 5 / PN500) TaxID=670386 RepID=D3AZM5_HETP5|nr:cytoplasmic dynein intermediate chain [Heterostelium album PN500]EFA85404.1 cytoplasmic dynein intermediate chain [Heterostelium album PN500]|eukprot:XP_020437513.1 cytoplasmic dynein intermediate chain [Heterostelium album PN500]